MNINVELLQQFVSFLINKLLVVVLKMKIFLIKNQQKNHTNQLFRNVNKRKVHLPFIDNIWGANIADMQLISKFKKRWRFFLWAIDIYSKCTCVIPLKDKKGITINNAVQKKFKRI